MSKTGTELKTMYHQDVLDIVDAEVHSLKVKTVKVGVGWFDSNGEEKQPVVNVISLSMAEISALGDDATIADLKAEIERQVTGG